MSWNSFNTGTNDAMTCEVVKIKGNNNQEINAYFARPAGGGSHPGVVVIHHMPGWDELYREITRRYAEHGYLAICPDLYCRSGQGSPDDIAAKVRGEGGISDDQVMGDVAGAQKYLKDQANCNGKIGVMGTCSGGRYTFLAACRVPGFSAAVECWGGAVVMTPDQLNEKRPVAPIDYTKDLSCPLIGFFGNDDQAPSPAQVDQHEAELKKAGKNYEFHRYDGAGHAFIYYDRPAYRQEAAMDAWNKIFGFFEKNLA